MIELRAFEPWQSDPLVTLHAEYLALRRTAPDRRRAYRQWCAITEADYERVAIRRAMHEGSALGTNAFQQQMAQALGRCVLRAPHGGPRRGALLSDSNSMQEYKSAQWVSGAATCAV